ncbi:hypothetical protein Tco_0515167 [Tanacetum coccineum]
MMLLARVITQHYFTPTNNHLRTSSNTRNQVVIQDERVDIQSKNVGYAGNNNRNAGRQNRNPVATTGNGMVQQMEANDQTIQRTPQIESNPGKPNVQCYNCNARDEAGGNLKEEKNDFMLDNYYGDNALEELNAAVIIMAHNQPTDDIGATSSRSNADILSEVNALTKHDKSRMPSKSVHEHKNHAKLKTVINTSNDDQINSSIIFNDPYIEDNGGKDEHDLISHAHYVALQSLIDNELETFKERVKTLEKQSVKALSYKDAYEELEREIRVDKDKIDNLIKENYKLHDELVQREYETLRIRNETELSKKAFKERETVILKRL